jgi:hypothetical protein
MIAAVNKTDEEHDHRYGEVLRYTKAGGCTNPSQCGLGLDHDNAEAGLIDEYLFIVTPVVAGDGKPLFKRVTQFGLSIIEARSFQSGKVVLHNGLKK